MATTTKREPISRMGVLCAIAVFFGLVADGMDLQLLSLSLPVLMEDFHLTKVMGGWLSTWTLVGMLFGGIMSMS